MEIKVDRTGQVQQTQPAKDVQSRAPASTELTVFIHICLRIMMHLTWILFGFVSHEMEFLIFPPTECGFVDHALAQIQKRTQKEYNHKCADDRAAGKQCTNAFD